MDCKQEISNMNPPNIPALHAKYIELTGQKLRLDYFRERCWFDWASAGFSENDLTVVVEAIKRGIRSGDRKPGALKFSNLIGAVDRFEEDLQLYSKPVRKPATMEPGRSAVMRQTCRPDTIAPQDAQPVSQIALRVLSDFKAKLKEGRI